MFAMPGGRTRPPTRQRQRAPIQIAGASINGISVAQTAAGGSSANPINGPVNLNSIAATDNVWVTGSRGSFPQNPTTVALNVAITPGGSGGGIGANGRDMYALQGVVQYTLANTDMGDRIGVVGAVHQNVSDTNAGIYAFNGGVFVDGSGAVTHAIGIEIDNAVQGASAPAYRVAFRGVAEGTFRGTTADAWGQVGASGTGNSWSNLFSFSNFWGNQPLSTSGNFFSQEGSYTFSVANIFNLPNVSVTGDILNFPNVVLSGAGNLVLSPNKANPTPNSGVLLTVSGSAGTLPTPFDGALAQIAQVDGANTIVDMSSFGTGTQNVFKMLGARGTAAAPSATQSGDVIGAFSFTGYGASQYNQTDSAYIAAIASQNFSNTASGTYLSVHTIPNGQLTSVESTRFQPSGGMSIGTATDPGVGNVLANGFINSAGGFKRVTSNFSVTSSTALTNITGLSVTLAAAGVYIIEADLFTTCNSSGGEQFGLGGTATATSILANLETFAIAGAAAYSIHFGDQITSITSFGGGANGYVTGHTVIRGLIVVNAGGTLTIQYAQNTSNAAASNVLAGSYMKVLQVS